MAGGGAVWVGAGCVVVEVDTGRRDDVVTDGEGRETALRRERCRIRLKKRVSVIICLANTRVHSEAQSRCVVRRIRRNTEQKTSKTRSIPFHQIQKVDGQ